MNKLGKYRKTKSSWRAQLRENERRTKIVLTLFIGLYLVVGFLIDVIIAMDLYRYTLGQAFHALLTFREPPFATLIMVGIGILSILITYAMHDKLILFGTTYKQISPDRAQTLEEKQLYNVVDEMRVASSLRYMPKVYIIEADYMNAFASGYSEKSALVAITRGLMQKLDRSELQAVMAHELSHIRHHDIKLTLMASVLSNIMLIVIDILFRSVLYGAGRKQKGGGRLAIIIVVLRFILPIITVLLMLYLSRTREYMADAGAVELMRDNEPMASALIKIQQDYEENYARYRTSLKETANEDSRRAAYIFDPSIAGITPTKSIASLFSTHPTIQQRLKALGYSKKKAMNDDHNNNDHQAAV